MERIAERFDKMGIPRINSLIAFDKGDLFERLSLDEDIRPYLPFTRTIRNLSEARRYIRSIGNVYIKARRGRRGMQVMQVTKVKHRGYRYRHSYLGSLVRDRAEHFRDMRIVLRRYFGSRRVIIQEAIDIVKADHNRAVDFRGEVQRNGKGEIEIVAIPIRVGKRNSPISTHGEAYRFEYYLPKLFPHYSEEQIEELKNQIHDFLVKMYNSVEENYGHFGEIGVDFGVDRNGNIRLIEANAQSAKVSIGKAYDSRTVRKIYLNPLLYAKKLAKRRR
ncbi:YheC/YheD family protein [Cohnella nanjingensis]|uniref:YheC/YheD family protein n=1 Tax=Cohnella nanjingensis TaxID=1387779 RepID=A0A7X0RLE9_9BACL|nr:YheC/YheD family protein [Cohnella nanjingensis]MBB6669657.1 YheC/YheD family protein [Cohnella nanjingensis]